MSTTAPDDRITEYTPVSSTIGNLDPGASGTGFTYRVLSSANDHQANSYLIAEGRWF